MWPHEQTGADPLLTKDILRSLERFETVGRLANPNQDAIDCSIINRLSFWMLDRVSLRRSCEILWTEDLNHGQIIRGVVSKPLK